MFDSSESKFGLPTSARDRTRSEPNENTTKVKEIFFKKKFKKREKKRKSKRKVEEKLSSKKYFSKNYFFVVRLTTELINLADQSEAATSSLRSLLFVRLSPLLVLKLLPNAAYRAVTTQLILKEKLAQLFEELYER